MNPARYMSKMPPVPHVDNTPQELRPGFGFASGAVYFPDSRVASDGEWVSPLSQAGAALTLEPNEIIGPSSVEYEKTPESHEQGIGRSPGQQWPSRLHPAALNFDSLDVMPFEFETYPGPMRERAERPAGWQDQPMFYEQNQDAGSDLGGVAVLADPQSAAYTIGWGVIENG